MSLLKKISMIFVSAAMAVLLGCQGETGSSGESAQVTQIESGSGVVAVDQAVDVSIGGSIASGENSEKPSDLLSTVAAKFVKARPDLKIVDIKPAEAEGVYQLFFEGKGSVYLMSSGDHFFVGDLYHLDEGRIVNVTEESKNGPRAELMASIKQEDMIIFSPEGEVKASVIVFTDVDCGYCRKLHREVPAMNALGIEIKYLAYPRAGVGSESYKKIASAWCAEDRNEALSKLKAGVQIPVNVCDGNPVAEQFNIGLKAGLNGTPALILESGELIPGYLAADKLAKTLGI